MLMLMMVIMIDGMNDDIKNNMLALNILCCCLVCTVIYNRVMNPLSIFIIFVPLIILMKKTSSIATDVAKIQPTRHDILTTP